MTPFDIQVLVADLVRADLDADLIGRVAAALVGVAQAPAAGARSKGAERTARWRARKRKRLAVTAEPHQASQASRGDGGGGAVDGGAVAAPEAESPEILMVAAATGSARGLDGVTLVTLRDGGDAAGAKEGPPHPLKKTTTPKPPVAPKRHKSSRQRFGLPSATPVSDPERAKIRVAGDTALHFELLRQNPDRRIPDTGASGWWWHPDQIAAAEARLRTGLVSLPVGTQSGWRSQSVGKDGQGEDVQRANGAGR